MQAIVLAAGEGSRMKPLTSRLPKVMLPVAGRPLLEHIIARALKAGARNIILVIGYGADSIRSHFGDGSSIGIEIDYAVQERQLGTGDALMAAESQAHDRFLVLNGDVIPDIESLRIIASSDEEAVAAIKVSDPGRYGVFLEDGGYIKSVIEKSPNPQSNLANAGIYLFKRSVFDALAQVNLSKRGEYELTDALNILAKKERIRIIELKEWMEIGRPWDILSANEMLLKSIERRIEGSVESGAVLNGDISVGRGTIIRSGAYITGPVIIGEECDIGPNCYIRPSTCIGNKVRIGNAVEVKNSVVMDGTKIGHLSYVGDSIIGSDSNFGAGTICANLRHDKASVKSYVKGVMVNSGRRKLGAIIGDNVYTGIHTTIYPGTVIESEFRGFPAAILNGFVSAKGD